MNRHPETQYLDLLKNVLDHGDERIDRTGVGTRSLFGATLRFDLSEGQVPIFTTKKVFWKTAFREMLWFLRGRTDLRSLLQENVKIWTDWPLARYRTATGHEISQDEFEARILADVQFSDAWGDLGPIYGKQWRRWTDHDGSEIDQVANLIDQLRTNPTSRRMLFHAWNVAEIGQMALPPCHMVYQFHTTSQNRLNCLIYIRSQDLVLGGPFNYPAGAALLHMIAQQTGFTPGELVITMGDAHVYLNHIDQAREQIARDPRPFPTLRLARHPATIDDYKIDDFIVEGYDPHPPIAAPVAV